MAKVKLTKGELKRQRNALRQYQRYLPTLQLKKQQLQMEIFRQLALLEEKTRMQTAKTNSVKIWAGLLADSQIDIKPLILPKRIISGLKNIAGIDIPVFDHAEFEAAEYDLFIAPLWVDSGIEALRELASLNEEIVLVEKGIELLRQELRITTQRVNLFEKVRIPEAEEAIHLIRIYIGDQMTNAVGRSKMAKRKIEESVLAEMAV